ncbi:type II toxin-antitoxin system RelE/ParE family toxin [Caballeronia udeis]|nr:type II toxin-antitoxin system RelE/ParE family toxin [Caballeronia udeis]
MLTIVETRLFKNLVSDYWSEDERGEFCSWLANNPDSGDVIPGSGSCRKVRWKRQGSGKSGGVRIIYYNRLANGEIWLLTIYAKSAQENIPSHILKAIKEAIDHA